MTLSSLLQECQHQNIKLSLNEKGGLHFESSTGKIRRNLKNHLIANKSEIIQYFKNRQTPFLLNKPVPANQKQKKDSIHATKKLFLNALSSEEITHYRLLLEESYQNPENDAIHGDDTPQHFRNGTHTFEMMEVALEKFIRQKQKEEIFPFNFTKNEIEIIRSYPISLHGLLTTLLDVRDGKYTAISLTQQALENFSHNMGWFFVSIESYIKGWHPADIRTLWSDGWRKQDIIRFMASQKVKYILCHNDKIIQCLDLNNGVYVFEKNKRNYSQCVPSEEVV